MSSTFLNVPKEYWITNPLDPANGKQIPTTTFVQFVPGVCESCVTSKDSGNWAGDDSRIGSIIAMPHFSNRGLHKGSMAGEEFRYYPLLRGIQETPVKGDPVLLTTIGGKQYYLGPLNTEGQPNFNKDDFKSTELTSGYETGKKDIADPSLFTKAQFRRMEKRLNPILDTPLNPDVVISNEQHGDMMLEGRHGNSIRIGSRNINPYIMISNGRETNYSLETSLDGTIMGIFHQGSIRNHFNNEWIENLENETTEKHEFQLADETLGEYPSFENVKHSISQTFASSMGRGEGPKEDTIEGATGKDDPDIKNTIYDYEDDQFFLSSDRITFNARRESMFLASKEFMHFGSGNNITFSTSNSVIMNAANNVAISVPLFKVESDKVYIDGRNPKYSGDEAQLKDVDVGSIFLGNPSKGDTMHKAVCGDALLLVLTQLLQEVSSLAWETAQSIENRSNYGGSVKIMRAVSERLEQVLGMESVIDPVTQKSEPVAKGLQDKILSNHVRIKQ